MKDVDPVEELHKIRWAICKKAGGTPADYARYYLEMDRERVAAESKTAKAKAPKKPKAAQDKSQRKTTKPAAKPSAVRKSGQRRKAVAP